MVRGHPSFGDVRSALFRSGAGAHGGSKVPPGNCRFTACRACHATLAADETTDCQYCVRGAGLRADLSEPPETFLTSRIVFEAMLSAVVYRLAVSEIALFFLFWKGLMILVTLQ